MRSGVGKFGFKALIALVVLGAIGPACKPKNPFAGSWDSDVTLLGNKIAVVHNFQDGGAHSASFEVAGVKGNISGTYSHEGDRLSITPSTLTFDDSNAQLPKMLIEEGKKAVEAELKKPHSGVVEWRSGEEFAIKPEGVDIPPMLFRKRANP